jgi:hypothetical protein
MANGGIIGPVNIISVGGNTVTTKTSTGTITTQPGTRFIDFAVVAGGAGGGGGYRAGGGGAGGLQNSTTVSVLWSNLLSINGRRRRCGWYRSRRSWNGW